LIEHMNPTHTFFGGKKKQITQRHQRCEERRTYSTATDPSG